MRGTIAGVYGDTGIFYSTAPDTNYDSWVESGGYDQNTGTSDNTMTNNSGDVITPLNKWDAEQLLAWGAKAPILAIVDTPDQRGNAPWGLASGVAGPLNGYAWDFDWDYWRGSAMTAADMRAASDQMGPWQRIKYPGSRVSKDVAGSASTINGFANADASSLGVDLKTTDLAPTHPTTGQTDGTSPKAIRWAVGQLTQYKPEYVWVKVKVNDPTAILDQTGCPVFDGGTFGGDAGGSDNGKDHLWRYYEPSRVRWNGCAGIGKPADRIAVKVGDNFQYKLKYYNLGTLTLTNVVVKDTLPSGVSFVSSVPAQSSGPNPLVWNVGTLQPGQKFEAVVTVKATGSGLLENCVIVDTNQLPDQQSCESTFSGALPFLKQSKSVSPTTVAPGGTVQYTVQIDNVGTGPTGSPVTIEEYLPTGFTYVSKDLVKLNNANVTGTTTVNTSSPYSTNQPLFTVPGAINAGNSLILKFTAQVPSGTQAGSYCNTFTTTENGIPQATGSLACVDVGGGAIGDKLWRDWDGDGVQDADEEGLSGVTMELQNGVCTPSVNCPTTTTDSTGFYQFTGLLAGTYTVKVLSGVPAGYTQTGDPDEVGTCVTCNGQSTVTLAANEKKLDRDFGYKPGGTGSVGDKVFDDKNADGSFNGTDAGIPNVTVWLYEDTNGNGVIDVGTDALVATTTSNGSGDYSFTGLATGIKYIADVNQADPDVASYFVSTYGSSSGVVQTTTDPHNVGTLAGAYTAADFGFYKTVPGSIGDTVFADTDGDGTLGAGEPGLSNVTVKLYADSDGDGILDVGEPLLQTTVTNGSGTYTFTGLPAGNYIVDVDQADTDVPSNMFPSKDPIATSLTQGQNRTDIDFPFVTALSKAVDKSYANPGGTVSDRTLTYTITPRVPGTTLLAGVTVNDLIPTGTTYVNGSVNAGGTAEDTDDPTDGIIDVVDWNLGSNSVGIVGYKGGTPPAGCMTSVTIEADRDTWLEQADVDQNHGTDGSIDTANAANDKVGLLHFNIGTSTVPAGATVSGAQLNLTPSGGAGSNRQVEIHHLSTAWTEGTAGNAACTGAGNGAAWQGPNCTDDWASAGGNFGTSDYNATNLGTLDPMTNDLTVSVTGANINAVVNSWLTGGTNRGLAMIPVGSATNTVSWYTRTEGTTSRRPQIVITYTPNGCSGTTSIRDSGSEDTYIDENAPTSNFGTGTELKNKPESSKRKHSLVKWSLASVPAGVTIDSATMGITVKTAQANQVHEVHRMLTAWNEGTGATNGATWNDSDGTGGGFPGDWTAGTFGSGDYSATSLGNITPSSTGLKTLSITSQVQSWYSGAHTNNGVVLLSTGSSTKDAKYYSSEEGTAARRPTLTVNWSIPPSSPTGSNTMSASGMVVQNGDTVTVKQVLTDSSGTAVTNVAPSAVTIATANGANATCGSPSPTSQTVPANGSATFTWTCTITAVGTVPGSVTFAASATNGTTTWSSSTSNGVIVSPVLQFQVLVSTSPGVNVVTNQATLEDANIPTLTSNPVDTAVSSSIGDRVWIDADADGVQDSGEGNLAGVRVYIDADNDGVYDVGESFDTTDSNGIYHIGGLANGTYNVRMDITTLPSGYYPTTATLLSRTITTGGQQITDADFGVTTSTGQVGDLVWLDADEDGVYDAGETTLSGVVVNLYNDVDNSGTVNAGDILLGTKTTDANGNYLFSNMYTSYAGGNVNLLVDVVSGLPSGVELVGGGTDPKDVTLSNATPVVLTADFPYNYGGSIGDRLWYDDDGDGIGPAGTPGGTDTGEPYVTAGAVVVLYSDTNGNGDIDGGEPIYAVTFTDNAGAYLFDNLPPGNYIVKVDEQHVESRSTPGTYATMVPTTSETVAVALGANQDYTGADFGFIEKALLEGHVFHDINHNGVLDSGETRLPNVTVTATGTDLNGNPVSLTTTTDADGEYKFLLPPGTYTISYNTADPDIPSNLTEATTTTSYTSVTVQAGQEYHDYDFGRDDPGKIGDRVWKDDDGDGVQDAGEVGLGGVTVKLYVDANDNGVVDGGDTLLDTQATSSSGAYLFEGLPVGGAAHYVVQVDSTTIPAGYTQRGDPDQVGVCTVCDHQGNADLPTSTPLLTLDFGYQPAPLSVSGNIWKDNDGDGVDDGAGEPGIAGVTVIVAIDTNGDNITDLTLTAVTNANGDYTVTGIPSGSNVTITVDETTLPSDAYNQTGDEDEVGTCVVCDAKTTITNVTVNQTGKDFGYREVLGSISGTVVENADGDGLAEGGETAVVGVVVILTDAGVDGVFGTTDDVVQTTITDSNGDYSFPNLTPGNYEVTKLNPAGKDSLADRDGGNPDNIGVTLTLGELEVDRDFELVGRGAIGDDVWIDVDQDGVRDAGEPGIPSVTVRLYRDTDGTPGPSGGDTLIATTTTDADGQYLFTDIPAGVNYYVDVDSADPNFPSGLVLTNGRTDPTPMFNLTGGQTYLDADVGYTSPPATAVIGDFVWSDADGDGIQDPGEPGIAGVGLALKGAGPDGILGTGDDTTVATTTTDGAGHYLFTGVAAGEYRVDVTSPPAGTLTVGPQSRTDPTTPILVAPGDVYLNADFGYQNPALYTISDVVWLDADGDAVKDVGESGVPGVTVNLVSAGADNTFGTADDVVVATAITGSNGGVVFTGVPNGTYRVVPEDVYDVLDDYSPTTAPALAGYQPVTVAGANVAGTNFGYNAPVSIGDTVFSDADGDGVQDAGESGIPNVQVKIWRDTNNDDVFDSTVDLLITTVTTDGSGQYLVAGLPIGTYFASVDNGQAALSGYTPTTTDQELGGNAAGTQIEADLPNDGTSFLAADFGYQKASNPNVSGSVWHDLDRDGKDDGAGEPPIPLVTVALLDTSGNVVATTTTDANGNYTFPDVPPGNYTVVVTDTAGVLIGYDLTGGIDPWPITVAAANITGIDFGYARSPETGAIGDRVWLDADRDGVQDGAEAGLPNVALRLYRDNGDGVFNSGTDTLVDTTTTGLDGRYLFDGLPAGNYFVDVDGTTLPAGIAPTTGTTDPSAMVNLSEGEIYPDADFGYGPTAGSALGDRVWYDYDGDGVQDPGEPGIGGVTVTVNGPGCAPCTVVTDPDGLWLVTGLAPGTYTVAVNPATLPAGYNPAPTNGPISRPALVQAGSDNLTLDFGFNGGTTGSIGDTVFFDSDGDGTQDVGEPGIPNVSLNLVGPGTDNTFGTPDDVVLATTVTNANGAYDFVGLPAGNYRVVVTDVDQVLAGLNLSAGTNPTGTIMLTAGQDYNNADFPYAPTAGAIGNQVWHDLDGDGTRDAGEPGVEGVAVDLWQDVDGDGLLDPAVDNLIRSTTTDINGAYEFLGLGAAKYLVDVAAANTAAGGVLEGMTKTTGTPNTNDQSQADPVPVELTALSLQSFNADFGYTAPGAGFSLSGRVFDDVNGNGGAVPTDEAGTDTPVLGATVRLYRDLDNNGEIDPTDPLIGTAVTDANGDYTFTDLPNGNYLLVSDATSTRVNGYTQTTQIPTDAVEPATIAGANVTDQDFGYHLPAPTSSIGSRVWLDENADGIQDPGEPGLPNVTVELWDATHTVLLATTVTDADGEYRFGNLTPGTYQVDVDTATLPSGVAQTPLANPGTDYGNQDFSDNDGGGPDVDGYPVTLGANDEDLTADFGFNWGSANNPPAGAKGAIGDRVWVDADGDGFQDAGEPGLGGATVTIFYDPDLNGVYDTPYTAAKDQNGATGTGTTTTEPDGSYVFYDLPAGSYVVAVTGPAGYTQTGDPDHYGTTGANDHRTTTPVVLAPGDAYVNADFGYQPTVNDGPLDGSIGDTVWFDADADGVVDGGENGIPGVTVLLARDLDNDGVIDPGEVIATTTTDANGQYLFDGLPAGDYLVRVDDTAAVLQGKTPSYDADGIGTPNLADVTLAAGADVLTADFGYTAPGQTPATALIGDRVWVDADNDGVQDAGEPGLEGATVGLYDSTGTVLLASAITDENGNYAFGGLAAGTYVVKVTPPAGMTQTFDADGTGSAHQSTVTVTAGQIKLDQDFGYRGTGAIDGEVWKDVDADGTRDAGETSGIAGVTVVVYWDLDGDGQVDPNEPVVGQAVTDANGNYSVGGLPTDDGGGDARFLVVVTDDANKLDGYWHPLGGTPGAEDNSQPTVYGVTLTPGTPTNSTADFGYSVDPGAVGNFVWSDLDGDGVQDMGEPGLGGVKVTLAISYPNGDSATLVTFSASDGAYSFGNLLLDEDFDGAGGGEPTFSLSFTTPAGFDESPTGAGTAFTDNNWDGATAVPAQPLEGVTNMALSNLTDTAASYDAGFVPLADWGDLPDTYSTSLAAGGPRHVPGALYLGPTIGDIDPNGQPSVGAIGDGADEDGVTRSLATNWAPNATVDLSVTVNGGSGRVGAWLDFNNDGMFGPGEFFDLGTVTGTQVVQVTIPNTYVTGTTVGARFRAFDPSQLPGGSLDAGDFLGAAQNGEVEDYQWQFSPTAVVVNRLSAVATGGGETTAPLLALAALMLGIAAAVGSRRGESRPRVDAAGSATAGPASGAAGPRGDRVSTASPAGLRAPAAAAVAGSSSRKAYQAPRIVHEVPLETRAGSPLFANGNPFSAEGELENPWDPDYTP